MSEFTFWIIFLSVFGFSICVEVHFENKDGGFFLKHSSRQHYPSASDLGSSLLSVDRFTVFQSSEPISVRATYGPFSTKQTVPARYIVPDPLDNLPLPEHNSSSTAVDLQELATHHLDMSAHIVRTEIPRDSPLLRVLFHTGSDPGGRRQLHQQKVCIVLHATMGNRTPLTTACSPDGEDGICLAQVTVPSNWWPPLPPPDKDGRPGKPTKTPPRLVQIAYSVLEPRPTDIEGCQPRLQIQPVTVLGMIPLVPARTSYRELMVGDALTMLIPQPILYPLSRIHVPTFLSREKSKALSAIVVRCRVKSGLRILGVTPSYGAETEHWNISVELNARKTGATVTALRREPPDAESEPVIGEVVELFSWLIEVVEDAAELYDGARLVWFARFEPQQPVTSGSTEMHHGDGRKPITRLEVQKDDIQEIVPISKNWEVLNTAVLTGRQVSQAMKVFIVSQAGKAADVTLQSSCHSADDSVLKVSSSCSSVYVDGSEARGSVNGSVLVKYGSYTGIARFTVWMPEFPLDLQVADTRLSQLKLWKVLDLHGGGGKMKRSYGPGWGGTSLVPEEYGSCRLRYQQTPVDVYAHFMATDHDSGRVTYFVNRRTWLRVTDLVLPSLRVSDPRIVSLRGRILQGRSTGRTEVQVLSPITGRVIGAKEVRVGNDKVGLTKLGVRVVSGLQLNILPDSTIENGYIAETSVTRKLTAQYQEGLLDIEMEFSDGTRTPLRDVTDSDYRLVVESLDPEVVAFAPMVASHHPRVIAVGEGSGDLLQVTLLLPEECRGLPRSKGKGNAPLATAAAAVTVDFSASDLPHRPDLLQNDGRDRKEYQDLHDILNDEIIHEPTVQARQHHSIQGGGLLGRGITRHHTPLHMTPLEISMYVLLAAFCFAIVVFVVSCVVYASKFKPSGIDGGINPDSVNIASGNISASAGGGSSRKPNRETVTNAHDWVWLGRATLERNSTVIPSNRNSTVNNNINEMRITANPLNVNYCDPDDCVVATSFTNPNHIELPSRPPVVDSSTYSKTREAAWSKPPPPPPPHAHAVQPQQPPPPPLPKDDDYRPPVPPHRNIGVSARMTSPVEPMTPPRKNKEPKKTVFEFDDAEPEPETEQFQNGNVNERGVMLQKQKTFVAREEVKRATIVGNPMFSEAAADLPGLDDLQLDMDYEQIMHYFDNLKESNA